MVAKRKNETAEQAQERMDASAMPVPIQKLFKALGKEPGDKITPEEIASLTGKENGKLRNEAFTCMNGFLKKNFPEKHAEYDKEKKHEERRKWLAVFTHDWKTGCSSFVSKTQTTVRKKEEDKEQWLLFSELAGPKGYNDDAVAAIHIKTCRKRLCTTNKALRDEGYHEYEFTKSEETNARIDEEIKAVDWSSQVSGEDSIMVENLRTPLRPPAPTKKKHFIFFARAFQWELRRACVSCRRTRGC